MADLRSVTSLTQVRSNGTVTLPETETETDEIGAEPNGNLCWPVSLLYEPFHTILNKPLFIGIGVDVGQCEHTIKYIILIYRNVFRHEHVRLFESPCLRNTCADDARMCSSGNHPVSIVLTLNCRLLENIKWGMLLSF